MRGIIAAGGLCAGLVLCAVSLAEEPSYSDCVQECRDSLPPDTTLQQCINDRTCAQYPQLRWTYEDCVRRCTADAEAGVQSLQQCIARFVCSQYPRE